MESYNELNGELITDRWNKTGATSDREMMEAKQELKKNLKSIRRSIKIIKVEFIIFSCLALFGLGLIVGVAIK